MKGYEDAIVRIKKLLRENPKGLTITDLSDGLHVSRNAVAKYMDILLISGQVEMQTYGPAKVYFLSSRIPLSAMVDLSSDLMIMFDQNLKAVQVNERLLHFLELERDEIIGMDVADIIFPFSCDYDPANKIEDGLNGERFTSTTCHSRGDSMRFFNTKILPSTFDDGSPGVTMILEDVTEQKTIENSLRVSKENLSNFFNSIDDFLFVVDEQRNIVHVNDTVVRRLGYTEAELIGQSIYMIHPRERREEAGRIAKEMIAGSGNLSTVPFITKDGHQIQVETRVTKGAWDGMSVQFGVSKDVTQLRLSEEKFSRTFNMNPEPTLISTQKENRILDVNRAFLDATGYSREEVVGRTILDLDLFADSKQRTSVLKMLRRSEQLSNVDISIHRKDGAVREGFVSTAKIDYAGMPCILSVMIDITERKQAEEKVRSQSALLNSLLDSIPDIIFYKDVHGVYIGCNPPFAEFVGRPKEEIIGRTDYDLFDKKIADFFRDNDQKMLELRQPRHNDEWITYHDGRRILIDTLKTPYWGPDGKLIGILGISRDITDRKLVK